MNFDNIGNVIISFICGGGLVGLLNYLITSRKNNADILAGNIDAAIKLRDKAIMEYHTAEEKLGQAQQLLNEVSKELTLAKDHIKYLEKLLDEEKIIYKSFEETIAELKGGRA